ncbi:ABC transporter ATP-binding protein [Paenibacillus sp. 1001270B_150601_E10]|uniref:ABC transporter ATP-binding protein n=1 Tax=Paenibacillus sp. 1001270B_150601_E10 TaxID=2787079 RepID=UPI002B4BB31D|nr:ABC transporter ATP-binding protein [Paenibacillus sp. 1001270B_150601_E10]
MVFSKKINVFYLIKIVFRISPVYASLILAQRIIKALIPSIQVFIVAQFINSVIEVVTLGNSIQTIYGPVAGIIATLAYLMISDKLIHFIQVKMLNEIREEYSLTLFYKKARLSYKHIEDSKIADLISRVTEKPEQEISEAYNHFTNFLGLIITVSSIAAILLTQVWWAALLLIAISIPLFWLAVKSGRANYEASREVSRLSREYQYLGEVLTGRESVEERYLFGYGTKINHVWFDRYERARKLLFKTELKWFAKMKLGGLVTSLLSLIMIIVLLPSVLSKAMSIGLFISLVNSTNNLVNRMTIDLTQTLDSLARNAEYAKDLQLFLDLDETAGAADATLSEEFRFETLEFVNVSFKYPNTQKMILQNMSFKIENSKHYAFVGLNGAGKTTITKLITGLYDEFEGAILINGKSIREYTQAQIKSMCAVAYQDFARYSISMKENIAIGDVNRFDDHEANLWNAIKALELEPLVERLPQGLDTYLGKIKKSGVDLSGGQWQRVALARFMINRGPLRILDEPTAALDPVSESRLYEKFEELCRGQTTIFISHRLSSIMLADEIFVMDQGRVVEQGAHAELMSNQGLYAQLYDSQRCWYQ